MANAYHLRRAEKAITDHAVLLEIIARQKYLTLALCSDDEPYLVTVNYGFDVERDCFYFHCAGEGRKIDLLKKNPKVCGQVLEDLGYLDGACDHAFRTVQFQGEVSFVTGVEAKQQALHLMIDQLESSPDQVKARFPAASFERVTIGCVRVLAMSGKENIEKPD